jgi:23S rRNA (guanosine2251-2'-O)-methyltransferase
MIKKTKEKVPGELIYGLHPLIEVLKAKRRKVISIYTTKPTPKGWKDIEALWPKYPLPIQYVSRDILHRMAGTTEHQGVVAWVNTFPIRKKMFEPTKHPMIMMLDGLQDPRNIGAILRSAYCTGVDGIIVTEKNSAPFNATVFKSSAGLAEYLEIYIAPSAELAAQELKKAGYTLYLASFDGENAVTCKYTSPLCLVVGGEGFGISKPVYKYGTEITLPQKTSDISYNVSVAAGILLFIVATQFKRI